MNSARVLAAACALLCGCSASHNRGDSDAATGDEGHPHDAPRGPDAGGAYDGIVGAYCQPEAIPWDDIDGDGRNDGFRGGEAYLELNSPSCGGDACLVYQLDGVPPETCNEETTRCADPAEVPRRVYCTCRCDAPSLDVALCDCPSGYECVELLELGGDDVRGSYCVKAETVGTSG